MGKIMDIRVRGAVPPSSGSNGNRSRVHLDAAVAASLRKASRLTGMHVDELLLAMLRTWIKAERPELEIVEADVVDDGVSAPQRAPRRKVPRADG